MKQFHRNLSRNGLGDFIRVDFVVLKVQHGRQALRVEEKTPCERGFLIQKASCA
jgi:hypothetical protein